MSNASGDRSLPELVVNFPDYTPEPRPDFPENVRNSNPFDLVAVGNKLYVANGGQNLIHQVDISTGAFSKLCEFPAHSKIRCLFNPNDLSTA